MKKVLVTAIITILTIIILFVALPFCVGYTIIWETNIKYDYQAIGAWGTWAGGISTALAVVVALFSSFIFPKQKNLSVKLILDYNHDKVRLFIANIGNAPVILNNIDFYAKNLFLNGAGFLQDEYNENEKPTVVNVGCACVIDTDDMTRLWYYRGHTFDVDKKNKNYKIIIKLIDFSGKVFRLKTKVTLGQLDHFYDIRQQNILISMENQEIDKSNEVTTNEE